MNTPKITFLEIRFLRIALKSQHTLAGTTQNRQETDLLIPKQGGTWAISNGTCCFWVNTSSQVKKASQSSRKMFRSYRISKNDLESSWGGYNLSWGFFSWQVGIWSWLMPLLIPVITILMLLVIAPCIVNCLTRFVSAQVNKLQHAVPVQQGHIKLHLTMEDITHPSMDTTVRTLKLETSKREGPNAPCCPSSAGSSKRDLDAPVPKELGLPSLEGGILGS